MERFSGLTDLVIDLQSAFNGETSMKNSALC